MIESNLFEKFKKLKKLHLDGNEINEIESNVFRGLENLEELDLMGNKLTKIESNSFQHLIKLKRLDLRDNFQKKSVRSAVIRCGQLSSFITSR